MMGSTRLFAVAICLFGFFASKAFASESLTGSLVMPKSDHLPLYTNLGDADSIDAIDQIEWPAMASQTNGCWVHLKNSGGYAGNKAPTKGWVRADQLVKLDSAPSEYANHLNDQNAAVYYWLNGICWENQGSPDVAITNYEQAAAKSKVQLDDVETRLGRLYAANYFQYGTAKSLSDYGEDKNWETHFTKVENAKTSRSPRPQLYYDWGVALTYEALCADAQQRSGQPSKAQTKLPDAQQCFLDAGKKLNRAEDLAPTWSLVPLARAQLFLDCCTVTEAGVRKFDPRMAERARDVVACLGPAAPANCAPAEAVPTPVAVKAKAVAAESGSGGNSSGGADTNGNADQSGNGGGGKSHILVLWDRHADRQIATFDTVTKRINSVAIHVYDGKTLRILSGGEDGDARLWEWPPADGGNEISKPTRVFPYCSDKKANPKDCSAVCAVAFSFDGKKIAVGTDQGAVQISDAQPPYHSDPPFNAHGTSRISAIAFSKDGANLLTGSWDGTAKLWNIAVTPPVPLRTFRGHTLPITSVAIRSDAAATHLQTTDHANADSKTASTKPHPDSHTPADPNSSKIILTGSYDYSARIWNGSDGTTIEKLDGHCGPVSSLAFAGDNAFLTGSFDQTARLWTPHQKKDGETTFAITLLPHPGAVTSLAAPDSGVVQDVSIQSRSAEITPAPSPEEKALSTSAGLPPSADGRKTPSGTGPRTAATANTLLWEKAPPGHVPPDTATQSGAKSDGPRKPAEINGQDATDAGNVGNAAPTMVLTGCSDGHAEVWDANKAARLEAFGPEAGPVTSVAISDDGAYVVTASERPDRSSSSGDMAMVLAAAAKDCTKAISLNPKLAVAFRERADVLRLQQRLPDAQQSALNACMLTDFRDPSSLRLLAEIEAAGQNYNDASLHATEAALLVVSDTSSHDAFLQFRDQCNAVNPSSAVAATAAEAATPATPAPGMVAQSNENHQRDQNDSAHQVNESPVGRAPGSETGQTGLGKPVSIFALHPQSQKPAPPSPFARRFLSP